MKQQYEKENQQNKKVSVVVPCYNVSNYLDRCMESLVKQTIGIENIEVILVDDASTDDGATWEIIMKYEKEFPDTIIAIQLEQNMKQGGARNVGISYANGEYLMFVDADDWIALETIEHVYQKAKEYDADVVQYQMRDADKNMTVFPSPKEGGGSHLVEISSEEERKAFLFDDDYALINNCWRKLYRMSMVQDNHIQFAEHLIFEEPAFTLPVLLYEKRHYFLDEILYFHRITPGGTMVGSWDNNKTDVILVWRILIGDVKNRGLLQKFYHEIEYLFYVSGYAYNIKLLILKGYILTPDEVRFFVNTVFELFPNMCENPYLLKETITYFILTRAVLNMEITDENVQIMNDGLRKFFFMLSQQKNEKKE